MTYLVNLWGGWLERGSKVEKKYGNYFFLYLCPKLKTVSLKVVVFGLKCALL